MSALEEGKELGDYSQLVHQSSLYGEQILDLKAYNDFFKENCGISAKIFIFLLLFQSWSKLIL